jgi:hypothetical protein
MTAPLMALLGLLCLTSGQTGQTRHAVNPDAETQKAFSDRVVKYVELRKKVESMLPPLPEKAEPTEITRHQRALLAGLQRARSTARQGDIFSEDARHLIRRLVAGALSHEGSAPRQAIREENPGTLPVRVNSAFPTSVPLPTVPPQVLLALPRLPDEELEYRFLGTRLLLLDPRPNMVVDYMDRALPK